MRKISLAIAIMICAAASLHAQNKEGYTVHVVKWFEDIQTISAKYGVPVDVIEAVNNLSEPVVSNRQKILIPKEEKYWIRKQETPSETPASGESAGLEDGVQTSEASPSGAMSLGLMLSVGNSSKNIQNNSLDFYSGVLMAVKEAGENGRSIDLDVVDISTESSRDVLKNDDMVIGPFRYNDFASELRNNEDLAGKCFICPLDPRVAHLARENRNIVQIPPSQADQYEAVMSWEKGDNYILISSEDDGKLLFEVKAVLDAKGIEYKECTCSVQGEIEQWQNAYNPDPMVMNKVILAINSEAPLNNAIRNMCIEESKGNVICYAGSKAASYDSIPVENIHRAHLHTLCSYYIDYTDAKTLDFIHKFRALYNCEPSQYAFQGYDLASFLIQTYAKYGKSWETAITEEDQVDMLQSSFKMKRLENGGLINVAVRKVEYSKDYKTLLIR